MAPGVINLPLQAVSHPLLGRKLKAVVVAVGAGRKLGYSTESRIDWLHVRERSKASLAHRLVSIDLREIRLIHGASPYVLRLNATCVSKLMLDAQTPLHEIGRVEFAVRDGRDGDGWKTAPWVCQWRCAGKLALRKAGTERLICCDGCI